MLERRRSRIKFGIVVSLLALTGPVAPAPVRVALNVAAPLAQDSGANTGEAAPGRSGKAEASRPVQVNVPSSAGLPPFRASEREPGPVVDGPPATGLGGGGAHAVLSRVESGELSGPAVKESVSDALPPNQEVSPRQVPADASTRSAVAPGLLGGPAVRRPPARNVGVGSLPLIPWEGGPQYYAQFPTAVSQGWASPSFFPIGVWFKSVATQDDVNRDRHVGLNTYVRLSDNTDMGLVENSGMAAIVSGVQDPQGRHVGRFLADEADMWAGVGSEAWTGNLPGQGDICAPTHAACGLTVMERLSAREAGAPPGYANFGKGVMFGSDDASAARFVNDWAQLAVSSDLYWYTDPHICTAATEGPSLGVSREACRRAANYGLVIDKMRRLDGADGRRKPVWAFVEIGHPFTEPDAPSITGPQLEGAVMNSVIHEARGVVYFNNNFGGQCISYDSLRDCDPDVRASVTQINSRVTALATVLNTQSYEWQFNSKLDTMLKVGPDGSLYVFAMLGRDASPGAYTLNLPPGVQSASGEVLFEDRSVPVRGETVTDDFSAEYSYHVYKLAL
jgi:hypothetical protein